MVGVSTYLGTDPPSQFGLLFTGFLRPGLYGDAVTNFGVLDQIAALHWLQVILATCYYKLRMLSCLNNWLGKVTNNV